MLKETKSKEKTKPEIVVKDFFGEWCNPCKAQEPIIEELKTKYPQVKFEKIDVDKNRKESERFKIIALPTIIIQKDGLLIKKFIGVTYKKIIEKELDNLLLTILYSSE